MTRREEPEARRREVRRAWALMSGFDPDELEAEIDRRAAEIKAEMLKAIYGEGAK